MAQRSDTKLYLALVVLAGLGGALYVQQKAQKKEEAAHSFETATAELPKLDFTADAVKKVTKLVVKKPGSDAGEDSEATAAVEHVLVKNGETWTLEAPVSAPANQKNVESLLENLTKVEVKEEIASSADAYDSYDLTDDKAVYIQAFEGDQSVFELWTGKSGGRGQMARLPGHEGVYTIEGFSAFMAKRDTKGWRDLKIVEVPTESITEITIAKNDGTFDFTKKDEKWSGTFKKGKSTFGAPIKNFSPEKVDDMLRAYKTLNATEFGDGKTLEETGLQEPQATVTFHGESDIVLSFGSTSEGNARWVKLSGDEQLYAVSSWAADWAVAGETKFQKKDESQEADE